MQCPACEGGTLKPQSLEPGLAAFGCEQCRGALVSMLAYRAWRDGSGHDHGTADIAIEAQDYAKVRDFRAWLRAHPQSAALRMYLSRRSAEA